MIPAYAAAAAIAPRTRKRAGLTLAVVVVAPIALAGVIAGSGSMSPAAAAGCADPAQVNPAVLAAGGRPGWWNSDGNGAQRDANAGAIIGTSRSLRLPDRAAVIAVATALQESKLVNLGPAPSGSTGLFQQLTSYYPAAIASDPVQATKAFLGPKGSVPGVNAGGLVDVPNWAQLPLTQAAQAVQRSAFPDAYAQWEPLATQLVLTAAGVAGGSASVVPAVTTPTPTGSTGQSGGQSGAAAGAIYSAQNVGCAAGSLTALGVASNPGSPFHDGPADPTPLPRANPRTVQQAIAWAVLQQTTGTTGWYRSCLAFVARVYGWNVSGINYAIDAYRDLPPTYRHDGDRKPPPGSLLFWDTGQRAGHVAVYLGQGMLATTDMPTTDQVGVVPAEWIESKWGATYVGWAPPYFPSGA